MSTKNKTKNGKAKDQYILSLEYFSKLKFPNINNIEDLEKLSLTKENNLLFSVLLSGEYDLIICLFLIIQLITSKYLEIDSNEIKTLNNKFDLMINKEFKFMINFLLTIYKSIEKYLNDLIDNYVRKKFPENGNFSEGDYKKYMNFFDINRNIDYNGIEGKEIRIIYYNWTLIKKSLASVEYLICF